MEATDADMGTRREVELSEFDDDFLPCPLLQSLELRNVYKSRRIAARAHRGAKVRILLVGLCSGHTPIWRVR